VPAVTPLLYGEQPPNIVGGVHYFDVSVKNLEVDYLRRFFEYPRDQPNRAVFQE
jgi:hypothetical protein